MYICALYKKRFFMKTKYLFIYVFVGIAFLAASAWVFFSRGKSAKAIRTKYRLGGIMITCTAMLTTASCEGPGPFVTCYDPVPPEPTEDIVSFVAEEEIDLYKCVNLRPGDVLKISIDKPTYKKYIFRVLSVGEKQEELQRTLLEVTNSEEAVFDVTLSENITYKGYATIIIYGVVKEDPEELEYIMYGERPVKFI